jgi:hypothetical protein
MSGVKLKKEFVGKHWILMEHVRTIMNARRSIVIGETAKVCIMVKILIQMVGAMTALIVLLNNIVVARNV